MPDPYDETLIASASCFELLPDAEWVTYIRRSGATRRIRVVVNRTGPESLPGISGGSRPVFEILAQNSATAGISSSEVDTGGDTIRVAPRANEKPVTMRITGVVNHDAGIIQVRVQ